MRKWIPIDEADTARLEAWLQEMALKGWKLAKLGRIWARFEEMQPERLSYHLEAKADQNQKLYREYGWDYVGETGFGWEIYRTARKTGKLPPREEAALARIQKQQKSATRNSLITFLFWILATAAFVVYSGEAVMMLLDEALLGLYVVLAAFCVQAIVTGCRRCQYLRRLAAGRPTSSGKGRRRKAAAWIILAALLLTEGALWLRQQSCSWTGPVDEATIPYTSLEELETEQLGTGDEYHRKEYGNTAEFTSYLLAPVQYELRQGGRLSNGREPVMKIKYYDLAAESLAAPVMEALIHNQLQWSEFLKPKDLMVEGTDQAVAAEYQSMQYLFLRRGSRVIAVFYLGEQRLEEKADLFIKMVEGS